MPKNRDVIAIYSRKSRFTGKGESVSNQIDMCRAYIQTTFGPSYAENAVVFEDEGFSGGNLNRPDFKKMMNAAAKRQFRAVVVYRLDRISRNISDFAALIQELGQLDIDFISIRECFDTSSPMGRAMMYIASVFSQLERETIAERIRDNLHELAKTGRWLGGITPTGYTSESVQTVTVDGKRKKSCKLKLIPSEAVIVRQIYTFYLETDSLTSTESTLLKRQIKTKNGRNFTRFSIKSILQNPVYLIADQDAYQYFLEQQADLFSDIEAFDGVHGILAYHRTDQKRGKSTVYLPIRDWIISVGQHPGIIPAKAWIQVQESLARNKSKAYHKPRSNQALLTGRLWCCCGSRMYPKLSQRLTDSGQPVYTYICKMKERSKHSLCSQKNINGNVLDAQVLDALKHLSGDQQHLLTQLEKSKKRYSSHQETCCAELEQLQKKQVELQKKLNALIDSLAEFADTSAAGCVKQRIEELHQEKTTTEARIADLTHTQKEHSPHEAKFDDLYPLLASFPNSILQMTVEQKRAAIRTLVQRAVWDGSHIHVVLFGAAEPERCLSCEDSK